MNELKLFKISSSPFFQVRFKRDGKHHVRSLRTGNLEEAEDRARQIVAGLNINSIPKSGNQKSFGHVVSEVLARDQRLVNARLRNPQHNKDQLSIYKVHLKEQLGWMPIQEITFQVISDFVDAMFDQGKSITTIKHVMVFVSKTLKHAHRLGWIDAVPGLPTISQPKAVRPWLSMDEYQKVLKYLVDEVESGKETIIVRYNTIDQELRWFMAFMINTFLRPSDAKNLRHRNIEIVRQGETRYLRITTESSKTVNSPIISMPSAVPIYVNLINHQKAKGFGNSDHFIFLPKYNNRNVALQHLRLQFQEVLRRTGLERGRTGEMRTLYSLRHSAIMFRLLTGKSMDLLTLARNCRTSVEMIDRFYAKHLTAEMNLDILHSKR
jgi:integrase